MGKKKMFNTKADEYLRNSEFLKVLGQLPQQSSERIKYIEDHMQEREEVRMNIIFFECPYLDSEFLEEHKDEEEVSTLALEGMDDFEKLDFELLEKHLETGFRNWSSVGADRKSFRNYVLDYYHLSRNDKERKENSCLKISSTVEKVLRAVGRLEGQGLSLSEAIDQLSRSRSYENTTEKTWKEVIEIHENPTVLSLEKSMEIGKEGIDFLNEENQETNNKLENYREYASVFCDRAITEIRNAKNIKERERMSCAYSSRILKTLKYWESKKIEEMPAFNDISYEIWRSKSAEIMSFVFNRGYIDFLIQDNPELLDNFYGVCYNLMYKEREVDNKNMLEYINRNLVQRGQKPISESALSQWLKSRNLSFSGYRTSEEK